MKKEEIKELRKTLKKLLRVLRQYMKIRIVKRR